MTVPGGPRNGSPKGNTSTLFPAVQRLATTHRGGSASLHSDAPEPPCGPNPYEVMATATPIFPSRRLTRTTRPSQ